MKSLEQHLNESLEVNESLLSSLLIIGGCIVGYNYIKKLSKEILNTVDNKIGEWWSQRIMKKSEELNAEMKKFIIKYPELASKMNKKTQIDTDTSIYDWLNTDTDTNLSDVKSKIKTSDTPMLDNIITKTKDIKNEIINKFKSMDVNNLSAFSEIFDVTTNKLKNLKNIN